MTIAGEIATAWASKTITKMVGQPTNESVDRLEKELAAHAASEHTSASIYGYLGCIEDDAGYQTRTNSVYIRPTYPGAYCATIRDTHSDVEVKRRELGHKRLLSEYNTYLEVEQSLRRLITTAVDEEYILELKDEYLGYTEHTAKFMIKHLRDTWCQTTFHERRALKKVLEEEWDLIEHPMLYFQRLDRTRDTLTKIGGNVDISELIQIAEYSMALQDDKQPSKDWEKKPVADKSWKQLKVHFITEWNSEQKYARATANKTGYHSAANVEDSDISQLGTYLDNIAEAATADKEHIQQLTHTNDTLVQNNGALAVQMVQLLNDIKNQNKAIIQQNDTALKFLKSQSNQNLTPPGTQPPPVPRDSRTQWVATDEGSYCWTHGFNVSRNHNSCNCRTKAAGHKDEATRANIRGGSKIGKPATWRGQDTGTG